MKKNKIYIAGHTGLVGTALLKKYKEKGYKNIIVRTHRELDLINQSVVEEFFQKERPLYVILAAAKVGGINVNIRYPAEFIYKNIMIQSNVIHYAYKYNVKKLLFFGSACSYPRECPQPIKEEYLLSDYLEPTNEFYAIAKISGIEMCQAYNRQYSTNFICAIPTNVYGPNDDFNPVESHVIPALIMKFHEAKMKNKRVVTIWGTGRPYRDFIYVDDLVDAVFFLMKHYNKSDIINIASGSGISIKKLAYLIKEIVEYNGAIFFDATKPDGFPRKVLDVDKINRLGWQAKTSLEDGVRKTYNWYLTHLNEINYE